MPCKGRVLEFFARKGYIAVLFRYRGTWESRGNFLSDSPEKDIRETVDAVFSGELFDAWSGEKHTFIPRRIILLGSSFGGTGAILSSRYEKVSKAIAFSPVVDWTVPSKAEPIDSMYVNIRSAFGEAFRISKKNWNKLKRGTFFNPMNHVGDMDGSKLLIFHAKNDNVVPFKEVNRFAQKTGSRLVLRKSGGHFSLNDVMKPIFFKYVRAFLKE